MTAHSLFQCRIQGHQVKWNGAGLATRRSAFSPTIREPVELLPKSYTNAKSLHYLGQLLETEIPWVTTQTNFTRVRKSPELKIKGERRNYHVCSPCSHPCLLRGSTGSRALGYRWSRNLNHLGHFCIPTSDTDGLQMKYSLNHWGWNHTDNLPMGTALSSEGSWHHVGKKPSLLNTP